MNRSARAAMVDAGAPDVNRGLRAIDLAVTWSPWPGPIDLVVATRDPAQLTGAWDVPTLGELQLIKLSDDACADFDALLGAIPEPVDLVVVYHGASVDADQLLGRTHTTIVIDERGDMRLFVPRPGDAVSMNRLRHAIQRFDEARLRNEGAAALARALGVEWAVGESEAALPMAKMVRDDVDLRLPSTAMMLRRVAWREHAATADELAQRVTRWLVQRLWSLNEAPELVAHDDRHVARVDRLMAELIEPSVSAGRITGVEAALLSAAAWLHDWGHIGGEIDGRWFDHSLDVRYFHGLLSQWLLREPFSRMHGLDPEAAAKVGVLCAHHQAWTSCDDGPGRTSTREHRRFRELMKAAPASLYADATSAGIHDPDRAQLLVALLRVADAADVGAHRIPDIDEREDFLVFCGRREAFRLSSRLREAATRADANNREDLEHAAERAARIGSEPGNPFVSIALGQDPHLARLQEYLTFLDSTHNHYVKHSLVHRVAFVPDAAGQTFRLHVTMSDGAPEPSHAEICRQVAADVVAELDEKSDGIVRDVLERNGIEIVPNAIVSVV